MDLIVAVSSNWAIGKDNDLFFSLKTDMNISVRTHWRRR